MADENHNIDNANVRARRSESNPKEIPKQSYIQIDYNTSQCASYISQRSSSLETFDSPTSGSPTNSFDGNGIEATSPANESTSGGNVSTSAGRDGAKSSLANDGDSNSGSEKWLCNAEAMPSTMLHPAHRSTPLKDAEYLSTVSEEGADTDSRPFDVTGEDAEDYLKDKEIFMPGDLSTPILGYETMESRSKFTVYKIQVKKLSSESDGWFVFRRYSDFLHLNERLKFMYPGFRLALPPKRWFRDNFDQNFLEDRVLGLQAFLDNITSHKDICNSRPVRGFFCTDEPPGPHDSLEESRALCETLEETVHNLRQELQEKESEFTLLKEELALYKSQVELLTKQLRVMNESMPAKGGGDDVMSSSSTQLSLTRGDSNTSLTSPSPFAAQAQADTPASTPATPASTPATPNSKTSNI